MDRVLGAGQAGVVAVSWEGQWLRLAGSVTERK